MALGLEQLVEITSQPLLNYLLALSYERGRIDFSSDVHLNAVYADLLAAVYERGWERRRYRSIQGISEEDFVRILEEVALAAWHGDGRTTTVKAIEKYCRDTGIERLLNSLQEGAEAGVTKLLMAFYFRQSGYRQTGERKFEFTHKSFGEYLAAKRIFRSVDTIKMQLDRRDSNSDDGWSERDALRVWATLCGPRSLDLYSFRFLCSEAELRGKQLCAGYQSMIPDLISFALRRGIPMERLELALSYHEQKRQARNAMEALFATLSACSRVTRKVSQIDWPSSCSFRSLFAELQSDRSDHSLAKKCLCLLSLEAQDLSFVDFYGADLSGSMLRGSNLDGANLIKANLEGTNLDDSRMNRTALDDASLRDASLMGVRLYEAHVAGADFRGARLDVSCMEEIRSSDAILYN